MAAGQGFKTFVTGEVLTAGDVNGYLMQGINVFTNATARDAAITAPAEGQFAFTKDNNSLWYYDGAAWVASGATGDIEGVTATSPLTGGGTSGTVTVGIQNATTAQLGAVQLTDSVASTSTTTAATPNSVKTAYDLGNGAVPKSTVTTKGDLIAATGSATVSRLGVGTNGQVLKANSGTATGLEWGASSAAKSYSLLGTATLTGAGTITISGLSGYDNLMITVDTARGPVNALMTMRFNSSTGPYPQFGQNTVGQASYSVYVFQPNTQPAASSISFGDMSNNIASSVSGIVQVLGANGSGMKAWTSVAGVESNAAATSRAYFGGGMFEPTAVISSVSIICNAGGNNFTNGTMKVYGAV
jgi:hypothetical protein